MSNHYVGQRLSYDGSRCTVRYCGRVDERKGEWLGVEWDDSEDRGKHNGTYREKTYFKCISNSRTPASFIRPAKPKDRTFSFLEALRLKYGSTNDNDLTGANQNGISIGSKTIEEIGFEKIRRQMATLQELGIVVLDDLCITGIKNNEDDKWEEQWIDLDSQELNITTLDLSRNLLERWDDVLGICNSLFRTLRYLTLDGNRFRPLSEIELADVGIEVPHITQLSLSSTYLSWQDVIKPLRYFPSVKYLRLSSNGLGRLPEPLPVQWLQTLDLSYNKITALSDLDQLTTLSGLENLLLRHNRLASLATSSTFTTVICLDLTATWLQDIASLDPILRAFPALTELLTTNTPIAAMPLARQITIARLPMLEMLNYAAINATDRQKAEIDYINFIAKALTAAKSVFEYNSIRAQHPRYESLCKIHDISYIPHSQPFKKDGPGPGTLAAGMTHFTFHMTKTALYEAQQVAPIQGRGPGNAQTIPKVSEMYDLVEKTSRIPRSFDTYRIKGMVGKLFGIKPMACRLIWETGELDPVGAESDGDWSVSEDESDDGDSKAGDGDKRIGGNSKRAEHKGSASNRDVEIEELDIQQYRSQNEAQINNDGPSSHDPEARKDERKWQKREVELVDGTRAVGNWVEAKEARVRVELRERV